VMHSDYGREGLVEPPIGETLVQIIEYRIAGLRLESREQLVIAVARELFRGDHVLRIWLGRPTGKALQRQDQHLLPGSMCPVVVELAVSIVSGCQQCLINRRGVSLELEPPDQRF